MSTALPVPVSVELSTSVTVPCALARLLAARSAAPADMSAAAHHTSGRDACGTKPTRESMRKTAEAKRKTAAITPMDRLRFM